jgi:hypothetical protein
MPNTSRNVAREAGFETDRLLVTWRPNGTGAPLQSFARGNTVRRLERTGVGAWLVTFRAGFTGNGTVAGRKAHVSKATATAHVGDFVINSANELTVVVQTRDFTGAALEIAAEANTWITLDVDLELSSLTPAPDTVA